MSNCRVGRCETDLDDVVGRGAGGGYSWRRYVGRVTGSARQRTRALRRDLHAPLATRESASRAGTSTARSTSKEAIMALHTEALMHSTKRSARFGWRGLVTATVLLASGLGIVGGQLDFGGNVLTHTAGTYQRA